MSTMNNSVMLIGYPTKPVMDSENKKASFKLVVTEWRNGANCTNTFDCVAMKEMANRVVQRVEEKKRIAIEGGLRCYDYQDRVGETHTHTEVEVHDLFLIDKVKEG